MLHVEFGVEAEERLAVQEGSEESSSESGVELRAWASHGLFPHLFHIPEGPVLVNKLGIVPNLLAVAAEREN